MGLALFLKSKPKPSRHWCRIGKRDGFEFSKKVKTVPLVNASFAKQRIISPAPKLG
jgi:hypothetical protein